MTKYRFKKIGQDDWKVTCEAVLSNQPFRRTKIADLSIDRREALADAIWTVRGQVRGDVREALRLGDIGETEK